MIGFGIFFVFMIVMSFSLEKSAGMAEVVLETYQQAKEQTMQEGQERVSQKIREDERGFMQYKDNAGRYFSFVSVCCAVKHMLEYLKGISTRKNTRKRRQKFSMKIRRGDILYADLGTQYQGSMQGGMRPVIVVSNNRANKHSIALCEQVTALNFDRIIAHMGRVNEETLNRITQGVQVQVGVFDRYN